MSSQIVNISSHECFEYLNSSETLQRSIRLFKCPHLFVNVENITINALIDTGCEITCMSEKFYEENLHAFQKCPTLPVNNVLAHGATGGKPVKVKKQIYAQITIQNVQLDFVVLIVSNLAYEFIIGIDLLRVFKAKLDFLSNDINFQEIPFEHSLRLNYLTESEICINEDVSSCENCPLLAEHNKTATVKLNCFHLTTDEDEEDIDIEALEIYYAKINLLQAQESESVCMTRLDDFAITTEEIWNKINETRNITQEERQKLFNLLHKYKKVFDKRPGRISIYEHRFEIKENAIFTPRSYSIPLNFRMPVKNEIERMLHLGVIERCNSPYINPIVPVNKKGGVDVRVCLDARYLNQILIADHETMESTDIVLQQCEGVQVMSSLDLINSFWQIPLHSESKKFTAFLHEGKCYQFTVVPFGTKTSSAGLIRGLSYVIGHLGSKTISFVDDILSISHSMNEHFQDLENLLHAFQENNITIHLFKCQFFKDKLKFLGFIISTTGIEQDPEKVEAIKKFPRPRNVKQLRGFLGLVNFYAKFSKELSDETLPLLELLRKHVRWKWTDNEQLAFEKVKNLFIEKVKLQFATLGKPFYLQCDASDKALGAVLYQLDDNNEEKPLAFASRTLKGGELNYFTTEKELLAIIWSLYKFIYYLFGAEIIIKTDHKALTFLHSCKLLNSRLMRWILMIQDFNIKLTYIVGKENVVADILSRQCYEDPYMHNDIQNSIKIYPLACDFNKKLKQQLNNMAIEQDKDDKISQVKNNISSNNKRFIIDNNILLKKSNSGFRVVLPKSILIPLIDHCHESYGHIGVKKCFIILNECFFYPKLLKEIKKRLKNCDPCQRNKVGNQTSFGPMQNITPCKTKELLSIDFYGALPKGQGGAQYLLVTIDAFSKFVKLYPLKNANAKATVNRLLNDYFPKYGKPGKILCDQGTQFKSKHFIKSMKDENINLIFTSIRHPQANIVERVMRELSRFFRMFVSDNHSGWVKWVPIIESCMNECHNDTTELTPIELHLDKKPTRPWTEFFNLDNEYKKDLTYETKIELTRKRIIRKGQMRKVRFDKSHKLTSFSVGDLVLVRANNISDAASKKIAKFMTLFEGPYIILEKVYETTFVVAHPTTKKVRGKFNIQDLRRYYTRI